WLSGWPRAGIILAWLLTGAFVGLVISLIKYKWLFRYVALSLLGSLIGAILGGCLLVLGGEIIPHFRSVGLMLTGFSICLCSTLAVKIASRATLKYVGSSDPKAEPLPKGCEWDLLENVKYLFGRAEKRNHSRHGVQFIPVKDPIMAPKHALIRCEDGTFKLTAHEDNVAGDGVLKRDLEAGLPRKTFDGQHTLQDGHEILMGQTHFVFKTRPKTPALDLTRLRALLRKKAPAVALFALTSLSGRDAFAQSGEYHLVFPDRIQALRVQSGSEAVAFRLSLNVVNAEGKPQKISGFSPEQIVNGVRVFEGASQLKTCHVATGSLPKRYAILLVDVSGSMKEPVSDGRRKYDVMKEACLRFTNDFVPGVDYIAVIPFHSRGVIEGIRWAPFFDNKALLQDYINYRIPPPGNNTALFSAARAALARLQEIRNEQGANAQYLLVILTDGRNAVRAGDDRNLETSSGGVVAFKNRVEIPVITIGFGNDQNLNENDLRDLALPASGNYHRARRPEDLVDIFQQARNMQLDRLRITFRPQPGSLTQLVSPHTYRVQIQLDKNKSAEGTVIWTPGAVNVFQGALTPEESGCVPSIPQHDWLRPVLIFLSLFSVLLRLWFRPPKFIERSWADEKIALVWAPHISRLKELWRDRS
ncbi:MAG: VWA domain-containing protein, partial [Blastocatellia bacterium]